MRALAVLLVLSGCGRLGFDASAIGTSDAQSTDGADATNESAFFVDEFERADNAALGNGWIEKTPTAFAITDGVVTRTQNGDWTTNQVYRAAAEDRSDLEVSIEFLVMDVAQPDWPQVFVRGVPASFAGYYLWIETGPTTFGTPIDIARKGESEAWWTGLASMTAPAATAGERYRLRLSAQGANPVVLSGYYERYTAGTWSTIIEMHAEDTDPNALVGPGTWGFDGHTGTPTGPYTYDNFTATAM